MKIPVEIAYLTQSIIKASNDKERKLQWNIASASDFSCTVTTNFPAVLRLLNMIAFEISGITKSNLKRIL